MQGKIERPIEELYKTTPSAPMPWCSAGNRASTGAASSAAPGLPAMGAAVGGADTVSPRTCPEA